MRGQVLISYSHVDEKLTKAQASVRIDELQEMTGRGVSATHRNGERDRDAKRGPRSSP